ncbi:MAG: DUF342 domain-containing protein [Rhodocyclales bacterium]|nr:DUF342 domain-containing protein [Rhodocyclales bacterium]
MAREEHHPALAPKPSADELVAGISVGDIPLPDFISMDGAGVRVHVAYMEEPAQLLRFVERVFGAGAYFVGLDHAALSTVLYGKALPEAGTTRRPTVRIANALAAFAPERRELYKNAKSIDDGARCEYLFEPARLDRVVEHPLFGDPDENGRPVITGYEKQVRSEPTKLDADEFVAAMWTQGIRSGIDIATVRAAIESGHTERVDIAHRIDPTPGADATVQEQTDLLHRDDSPSILPSGKMDLGHFKNHFPQVTAGTCLLQKQPRRLGEAGLAIDGTVLEPDLPRDFELEEMAGPGTRIERTAKGEFLVAAQDGFLNIDKTTHQISITEKIVNREGVSQRTTGNLQLVGDEYEEHGEVQERRLVEGHHMDFHADVFGEIVSSGGNVHFHTNLAGGTVKNPGGVTQFDGRVSQGVIEARDGEVQAKHVEGSTLVAATVRLGRAIACDIVAEEVEIDEALGCTIAARRVRITRCGARRDTETLVTICIPDYAELDRRRAELEKEVEAIEKRLAEKRQTLEACMAAGEVKNYLAVATRIRDGGITLNEAQAAQWRQMTQKVARPLAQIQALRHDMEKLEATLAEPHEQLTELEVQREQAGVDIRCEVAQVVGEVAVQSAATPPGAAVFAAIETARLKQALRDTRIVHQRLFRAATGSFTWSWKPPAAT